MDYINNAFIGDPEVQNVFLGKDALVVGTEVGSKKFVDYLTDYTSFKANFLPSLTASSTALTTLYSQIQIKRRGTNAWTNLMGSDLLPSNPNTITATSIYTDQRTFDATHEITFRNVASISAPAINIGARTPMSVLELLNSLAAAYNFLDAAKFKDFKTGRQVTVKDYQGNTVRIISEVIPPNPAPPAGTTNNIDMVTKVLNVEAISSDTTTARTDVVRRLFLGYIYLIEVYIALAMYEKNTDTNNFATKNIVESCIKKFIRLNENMYETTTQDGVGKLYEGLEKRMQDYKDSKATLNTLSSEINEVKSGIRKEQNAIDSHSNYLANSQTVFYVFTTLFLVMAVLLVYIFYSPMQAATKQKATVVITGFSLLLLVLAFLVNKFVVIEPFQSYTTANLYADIALQVLNEYLGHTINVVRLIDTYRSYGEIATSINKEKSYYQNVSNELNINKGTLNAVQVERYRQAKILRFRTYLFIQILITLSFLMLLLSYQFNVVYIVLAAFIILMWVYFYIVNTNNLVRTDARKLYWNPPTMT
jgi:hypothetical protein